MITAKSPCQGSFSSCKSSRGIRWSEGVDGGRILSDALAQPGRQGVLPGPERNNLIWQKACGSFDGGFSTARLSVTRPIQRR